MANQHERERVNDFAPQIRSRKGRLSDKPGGSPREMKSEQKGIKELDAETDRMDRQERLREERRKARKK